MTAGPSTYLFADTVTVVRPGVTTDEYGNEQPNWAAATETAVQARLEPVITAGGAAELERDRGTLIGMWNLFLPPSATVGGHDRVRYGGELFEVVGPPAQLRTPRGAHHWMATLRHVDG